MCLTQVQENEGEFYLSSETIYILFADNIVWPFTVFDIFAFHGGNFNLVVLPTGSKCQSISISDCIALMDGPKYISRRLVLLIPREISTVNIYNLTEDQSFEDPPMFRNYTS